MTLWPNRAQATGLAPLARSQEKRAYVTAPPNRLRPPHALPRTVGLIRRCQLKILGAAFAALLPAAPVSAADGLTLPASVSQGMLVVGKAQPNDKVSVGGRIVRVDAQGRFVFGVGRDERGPLTLTITRADGRTLSPSIAVTPREWVTERVNGVPQSTVTPPPAIAERIAREQAAVGKARLRNDARSDFAADFMWPTRGRISGQFGNQRIYNGEPRSPHSGVDVAAASGTPLKAPAAGVVTFAAPDLYLTGGTVLIDHGHGVSSVFLHLSRIDVAVGDSVEAGQTFAAVGATGRATGPHMHWGLNWFDVRLDPTLLPGIVGLAP